MARAWPCFAPDARLVRMRVVGSPRLVPSPLRGLTPRHYYVIRSSQVPSSVLTRTCPVLFAGPPFRARAALPYLLVRRVSLVLGILAVGVGAWSLRHVRTSSLVCTPHTGGTGGYGLSNGCLNQVWLEYSAFALILLGRSSRRLRYCSCAAAATRSGRRPTRGFDSWAHLGRTPHSASSSPPDSPDCLSPKPNRTLPGYHVCPARSAAIPAKCPRAPDTTCAGEHLGVPTTGPFPRCREHQNPIELGTTWLARHFLIWGPLPERYCDHHATDRNGPGNHRRGGGRVDTASRQGRAGVMCSPLLRQRRIRSQHDCLNQVGAEYLPLA